MDQAGPGFCSADACDLRTGTGEIDSQLSEREGGVNDQ